MKPFLIGLTGNIGSGKSTAAEEFRRLGCAVYSGDDFGRTVVENSPDILAKIRERFGDNVFDAEGSLLRRELGNRVFGSHELTQWLTTLTFPGIYGLWQTAIAAELNSAIVFDAALIFEWGIERDFDLTVLIVASPEQATKRLSATARLEPDEIAGRLNSQLPNEQKIKRADVVIHNNGDIALLQRNIEELWTQRIEREIQRRRTHPHESHD